MTQEERICPVCGSSFGNKKRKYCCVECSAKANKNKAREYNKNEYKKIKTARRKEKAEMERRLAASRGNALEETAREAKEANMTYGQYVGMEYARRSRKSNLA